MFWYRSSGYFSRIFFFVSLPNFFSSCLSDLPVISFTLALGINAVKSWLSRMQGRVGSFSVSCCAVMSKVYMYTLENIHSPVVHLYLFTMLVSIELGYQKIALITLLNRLSRCVQ